MAIIVAATVKITTIVAITKITTATTRAVTSNNNINYAITVLLSRGMNSELSRKLVSKQSVE